MHVAKETAQLLFSQEVLNSSVVEIVLIRISS